MLAFFKPTWKIVLGAIMLFLLLPTYVHTSSKIIGLCPLDALVKTSDLNCEKIEGECICYEWTFFTLAGYRWLYELTTTYTRFKETFFKALFYLAQLTAAAYLMSCLLFFATSKIKKKKGRFDSSIILLLVLGVLVLVYVGGDISMQLSIYHPPPSINMTGTLLNKEFPNMKVEGFKSGGYVRTLVKGNNELSIPLQNFTAVFTVYGPFNAKLGTKSYQIGGFEEPGESIHVSQYFDSFQMRTAKRFEVKLDYKPANIKIKAEDILIEDFRTFQKKITAKITNLENKDFSSIKIYFNCQGTKGTANGSDYIDDGIKAGETKNIETYNLIIFDNEEVGKIQTCEITARENY